MHSLDTSKYVQNGVQYVQDVPQSQNIADQWHLEEAQTTKAQLFKASLA